MSHIFVCVCVCVAQQSFCRMIGPPPGRILEPKQTSVHTSQWRALRRCSPWRGCLVRASTSYYIASSRLQAPFKLVTHFLLKEISSCIPQCVYTCDSQRIFISGLMHLGLKGEVQCVDICECSGPVAISLRLQGKLVFP